MCNQPFMDPFGLRARAPKATPFRREALWVVSVVLTFSALAACGGGPMTLSDAEVSCKQGEARACLMLAKFFEGDPSNASKEPMMYVSYLSSSCESGHLPSCSSLGSIRLTGEGGQQDQAEAARLHAKACEGGQPRDCYTLGVQRRRGDGVAKDGPGAHKMFRKACDAKVHQGCANIGQMFTSGELGARDMQAAKLWYGRACDIGKDPAVCGAAGR